MLLCDFLCEFENILSIQKCERGKFQLNSYRLGTLLRMGSHLFIMDHALSIPVDPYVSPFYRHYQIMIIINNA